MKVSSVESPASSIVSSMQADENPDPISTIRFGRCSRSIARSTAASPSGNMLLSA
jgi:hypothetical protein